MSTRKLFFALGLACGLGGGTAVAETPGLGQPIAEGDIEFCKRLRFDDHGRVFHDVVPCDQSSMRDARGQPVPVGTVRRLDAISKSFSGH